MGTMLSAVPKAAAVEVGEVVRREDGVGVVYHALKLVGVVREAEALVTVVRRAQDDEAEAGGGVG